MRELSIYMQSLPIIFRSQRTDLEHKVLLILVSRQPGSRANVWLEGKTHREPMDSPPTALSLRTGSGAKSWSCTPVQPCNWKTTQKWTIRSTVSSPSRSVSRPRKRIRLHYKIMQSTNQVQDMSSFCASRKHCVTDQEIPLSLAR